MNGRSYTPHKTADYERHVRECYLKSRQPKLTGAIYAEITAYFPIPKSTSKKKTAEMQQGFVYHVKRPDADNVAKSILDALNGVAFDDDSAVFHLRITKRYDDGTGPRVEVGLFEYLQEEGNEHMDTSGGGDL